MNIDVKIDWETAYAITLASLKYHRKLLKKELRKYKKNPRSENNPSGVWMHSADIVLNKELILAMDKLIAYYGG
jgi:hypothetical protein